MAGVRRSGSKKTGKGTGDARIESKAQVSVRVGSIAAATVTQTYAQQEAAQQRELLDSLRGCAVSTLDPTGRILTWSAGAAQLTGWTAEEVLGRVVNAAESLEILPVGETLALMAKARQEGRAAARSWRARKDGSRYWAEITVTALGGAGAVRAFAHVMHDITCERTLEEIHRRTIAALESAIRTQRQAEESLKRSDDYYRKLIENAQDVMGIVSADGRVRYVSPSVERILGYRQEELMGNDAFTLLHPDDCARAHALFQRRLESSEYPKDPVVLRYMTKSGECRFLEGMGRNLVDEPTIRGIIVSCRDVSERVQAEERLRETQHFIESIAETVPYALYVYDLSTSRVIYANRRILERIPTVFDLTGADLTGMMHPDDRVVVEKGTAALAGGGSSDVIEFEFRIRCGNSGWLWVSCWNTVLKRDAAGHPVQILGTAHNITARKIAEETLRRHEAALEENSEMLRELAGRLIVNQEEGRRALSRELHDDLNQRLAVIAMELDSLGRHVPSARDRTRARLSSIEAKVVELCEDVRRMAHQLRPSILDDLGLVPAVRSYCDDFSRREHVTVRLYSRHSPNAVSAEQKLCLYRIVQEALRNAAKYSGTSRVSVRVGGAFGKLWLFVRDYGRGFDPKTVRMRRGLGLISMQERVRLAGGTIAILSRPGGGTRIAVRIPLEGSPRS